MRMISFIENGQLIKKILKHLGLPAPSCLAAASGWEIRNHAPRTENIPHIPELIYLPVRDRTQTGDDSDSQRPPTDYWLQ